MTEERNPNRPLVALRTLRGTLGCIKAWHVVAAGRVVPMPNYDEAQEWAYRLASQIKINPGVTNHERIRR